MCSSDLEDAAHAFGARYEDGLPVGSLGNLTCFSFYANKNLSTGDGGAIALDSDALADRLRSLRDGPGPSSRMRSPEATASPADGSCSALPIQLA